MPVNRQKSMLELSAQSKLAGTNTPVLQNLEVFEIIDATVESQVGPFQVSVVATSAAQALLEIDFDTLESSMQAISGALETDFNNLDLSINAQIDELFDTTTTSATSGAMTLIQPEGYITVVVNGVNKKIPYYGA